MADSTRRRTRRAKDDEDREDATETEGSTDGGRLSAKQLTEAGRETIAELTELEPESVTGLEWDGESWLVTVDVLELSRIPETTDVIATYIVQLDPTGTLLGYRRARRFVRGQVDSE